MKFKTQLVITYVFKIFTNIQFTSVFQVLNFYQYLWDRTHGVDPNSLFYGLPSNLTATLKQSMYGPLVVAMYEQFNKEMGKRERNFWMAMYGLLKPAFYLKDSVLCK